MIPNVVSNSTQKRLRKWGSDRNFSQIFFKIRLQTSDFLYMKNHFQAIQVQSKPSSLLFLKHMRKNNFVTKIYNVGNHWLLRGTLGLQATFQAFQIIVAKRCIFKGICNTNKTKSFFFRDLLGKHVKMSIFCSYWLWGLIRKSWLSWPKMNITYFCSVHLE